MSERCDEVFHGIDFSGAKKHRKKIWVSTWSPLADVDPRAQANTRNNFTFAELVRLIAKSGEEECAQHYWLIDAPFSLAIEQLRQHDMEPTWESTLQWLATFENARDWRRACRKATGREPKRGIDKRFKTPQAPMNIRLFKQTWHCMVSVLLPLMKMEHVAIMPMQAEIKSKATVWVGEGCPSSSLRAWQWPHRGYKGDSKNCRLQRESLLNQLMQENGMELSESTQKITLDDPEGDALDSLLMLPAAQRFMEMDHTSILQDDRDSAPVEGWIYV